jgi:hypothetical protein
MKTKIVNLFAILLVVALVAECKKEKDDNKNLLILAALASQSSTRDMYTGFADIPTSIYKTVASGSSSSSIQAESRTLATTDYKFVNSTNSASVSNVYDLVRVTAKSTRDITKSIGDLVKALESITVSGTLQGTDKWGGVASKYKYQSSTILSGGKKLEVWWNNGASPYSNNKAIEMNYTGSSTSGNLSGFVFVRFLSKSSATTLSKAYIKFDYNSTTNTRAMVVILQDIGNLYTDNAHFYVQEVNGITSMDGTYTVKDYNANSSGTATGVTAAARAYVFSAIGNSSKAIIRAAFPLTTDTTTAIYDNTTLGNIGQVWTNFILANTSTVSALNSISSVSACSSSNITSTNSSGGNPTTLISTISVANVKSCLDGIITATSSTSSVKDVYFITNIKNPAYFTVSGNTVSLYGVESLDSTDANKSAFDTLQNSSSFLTAARTTSNTTYPASLDAVSVSALNLFTGTNVPTGTSATDLTKLNAQWGNGTPGTGISSSSAGTNSVNGSVDNTAPF